MKIVPCPFLFVVALSFLLPVRVFSAPLSLCMHNKSGAISAKSKCARGETKVTRDTLSGLSPLVVGPQGPQGARGPEGAKGLLDPSRCVTRSSPLQQTNKIVLTTVDCAEGEFLLTHGVQTFGGLTSVVATSLLYLPGMTVPSGVSYETSVTPINTNYEVQVDAVCCK